MPMRFSWLAVPVLNTLFQFFIKHGAEQLSDGSIEGWLWQALSSYWILAAIAVEIACFFIWMNVLAELDLSRAFPLSGVSYVLIIATGWFVFGERIVALQVIGSGLILLGVWLIAGANVAPGEQDDWHVKRDGLRSSVGKDG
ncbi:MULTISPECIES: EamA family transporter [Rhizobium]|nr:MULTISPECIES: EamA family transporter [Rhizobium]MBB3286528.1 drug/metabolite transporter (DMT)-like permease [Rhizobium sp. BK252]MBB3401278.1 drug/metabolite transporter (DMT)-like permease [Rhizobium sp. BK289]MBB3413856.1 drug/metabolite transporter (DMT)-like permease [Rhizobium sp. BK284]MBB3481743.1 drug/metabolite transporter (DMT)-like permease [Rhizobium sp. BK347]MDK4719664.1 EamA family transporter [Rhizobium sp. CNPSo 3968]